MKVGWPDKRRRSKRVRFTRICAERERESTEVYTGGGGRFSSDEQFLKSRQEDKVEAKERESDKSR